MRDFARWNVSWVYVDIAKENFELMKQAENQLQKIEARYTKSEEYYEYLSESEPVKSSITKHALTTIIFSALFIEAYIYDFAARKSSDTFVKKYLDKMDVISKWVVVPKLLTGNELRRESRAYQLLDDLVSVRNKLVHYKSSNVDIEKLETQAQERENYLSVNASKAIETLEELANEMKLIDPEEAFMINALTNRSESLNLP